MARGTSKTILVMSDSHGNRDIVQELKDYYGGKVDAIFHNGIQNCPVQIPSGKESKWSKGTVTTMAAILLAR